MGERHPLLRGAALRGMVKRFSQLCSPAFSVSRKNSVGEIEGTFKIAHRDVTNIYHLLEQRMAKQNDASLVHFAVTVYYNDGNSVVHNNIGDFEKFHPTTKCHAWRRYCFGNSSH